MRRTAPAAALAALAIGALTACGGGDPAGPAASGSASPSSTAPASAGGSPGTPATPAGSLPSGCATPAPAPAGATAVGATVRDGKVVNRTPSTSDAGRYDVALGTPVRLLVTTDVADEVHVHGYDLRVRTSPGCPAVLDFEARVPGSVEVELESSHLELFELRAR